MTSYLKSVREWATPTLKSSAFLSRGVLTPEEFVAAGDELVYKCPTWSWEGGDPKKAKSYLPPDKQVSLVAVWMVLLLWEVSPSMLRHGASFQFGAREFS